MKDGSTTQEEENNIIFLLNDVNSIQEKHQRGEGEGEYVLDIPGDKQSHRRITQQLTVVPLVSKVRIMITSPVLQPPILATCKLPLALALALAHALALVITRSLSPR